MTDSALTIGSATCLRLLRIATVTGLEERMLSAKLEHAKLSWLSRGYHSPVRNGLYEGEQQQLV